MERKLLRASLLLIILQVVYILIKFKDLPNQVPLFYSLPWGEKRLAQPQILFLAPLLSTIFCLINFYFTKKLVNNERLLSNICSLVSLVIVLLFSIAVFQIIFIIT